MDMEPGFGATDLIARSHRSETKQPDDYDDSLKVCQSES